jgi:hypothetical protein
MTCIGEPISWLRLESFALGAPDPAIASHVAACPACHGCLAQIRDDVVALPPLAMPVAPRRARRWWWLAPAFAAAIVLVVVLRPPPDRDARAVIGVKGVGEVTLELVRERRGAISFGAARYAPGDRWKVVVSCAPGADPVAAPPWIDVSVADGVTTDHPLAAAQLACGNRVVVPGAFTITGNRANRVCARIAAAADAEAGTACVTVRPE